MSSRSVFEKNDDDNDCICSLFDKGSSDGVELFDKAVVEEEEDEGDEEEEEEEEEEEVYIYIYTLVQKLTE